MINEKNLEKLIRFIKETKKNGGVITLKDGLLPNYEAKWEKEYRGYVKRHKPRDIE